MAAPTRRIVVLDRDGVINRDSPEFVRTPQAWEALPGSLEAITLLCRAGFQVVVASNQSGVGRGLIRPEDLEAINAKMIAAVRAAGGDLRGIYVCPHRPEDGCQCRKPLAGLFRQIESDFSVALRGQPAIGDSARDIAAARAVGARAILVRTGNGAVTERALAGPDCPEVFDDLAAAARFLSEEVAT